MTILFGLGGYAKSGKDATARSLCAASPLWRQDYMSRPLEQALLTLNPWVDVHWENWEKDTYNVAAFRYHQYLRYQDLHDMLGYDDSKNCLDVRHYLQLLGTEVGRKMFGESVWIDLVFNNVDTLRAHDFNVAVTGIRFPNELQRLRERGGIAVWVKRPGYGPVNAHTSDNALSEDDFDITFVNQGSLSDLHNAVWNDLVPWASNGTAAA